MVKHVQLPKNWHGKLSNLHVDILLAWAYIGLHGLTILHHVTKVLVLISIPLLSHEFW